MRLEPRIFGEQVAMGKVQAEAGQPLHGNVALVCRPDDVSLHSELPDGQHKNLFAGTVLHASFVGGRWRTTVAIGQESQPLIAFRPSALNRQEQLWVELPPGKCMVVAG